MNDNIIKTYNEAQYNYLKQVLENKLDRMLKDEYLNYNLFLDKTNVSVLPDNCYKDGKPLNYGEIRRLYSEWENSKK